MRKFVALLLVAVAIIGCVGYMVVDSAFRLDAKPKVKKEVAMTDSGGTVTREFKFKSFDRIEAAGVIKIEFTQGPQTPVVVSGRQFEMNHLKVEVKGACLEIKFDREYYELTGNKRNGGGKEVTVKLSATTLTEVDLSLSSSFQASLIKQSDDMKISAGTSAEINIRGITCGKLSVNADTSGSVEIGSVNVKSLKADADTSGSIRVNGIAGSTVLKADTSGSVRVKDLASPSLTVKADTSGSVSVDSLVGDSVTGRADTSGDISLKGEAKTVDFKAGTSGCIKAGDLKAELATVGSDTGGKVIYCARNTRHTNTSLVNTYKPD